MLLVQLGARVVLSPNGQLVFNASIFVAGLFLLEFAADKFIDHMVNVARRLNISATLVSLLTDTRRRAGGARRRYIARVRTSRSWVFILAPFALDSHCSLVQQHMPFALRK